MRGPDNVQIREEEEEKGGGGQGKERKRKRTDTSYGQIQKLYRTKTEQVIGVGQQVSVQL